MEGLVAECLTDGMPVGKKLVRLGTEQMADQLLPHILYGLAAGMEHVVGIETIVAQLVVENLVGREITKMGPEGSHHFIGGQQKGCLRQLTAVIAVLGIADGTDRQHDAHTGIDRKQQLDALAQGTSTVGDAECLFLKQPLRTFLAIVDNLAGRLEPVNVVGAQGEKHHIGQEGMIRSL